jgi:2-polyprenyl-3-methyl-5-hydroxy-6-metoxy-1,4-benzoquinol methylase
MKSPITGIEAKPFAKIDGTQYFIDNTGTVFCEQLDQSGMVGGTGDRTAQDDWRASLAKGRTLDYGCGNGNLVKAIGIGAFGYDPYSSEEWARSKPWGKFDTAFMVEVIEHTTSPFAEIDEIRELLVPGGRLIIETSFSDWVKEGHPYLNPRIGHSTIFSHLGLDTLMLMRGFTPSDHINRNVRVYTRF